MNDADRHFTKRVADVVAVLAEEDQQAALGVLLTAAGLAAYALGIDDKTLTETIKTVMAGIARETKKANEARDGTR